MSAWLAAGVVRRSPADELAVGCGHLHVVAARPDTPGSKPRVTLDPGLEINDSLDKGGILLPSVTSIAGILSEPGTWYMAKIDLRRGFHHMIAARGSRHRFVWDGEIFEFLRLPFGPRDGPAAFQRCTSAIGRFVESSFHVRTTVYLDDFMFFCKDKVVDFDLIMQSLRSFGCDINEEKSSTGWSRTAEMLGMEFNLSSNYILLPQRKAVAITTAIDRGLHMDTLQLAVLCGRITSAAPAHPALLIAIRPLFSRLADTIREANGFLPHDVHTMRVKDIAVWHWVVVPVQLDSVELESLRLCRTILSDVSSSKKIRSRPGSSIRIFTDASADGAGCVAFLPDGRKLSWATPLPLNVIACVAEGGAAPTSSYRRETWACREGALGHPEVKSSIEREGGASFFVDNQPLAFRFDRGSMDLVANGWLLEIAMWQWRRNLDLSIQWIPRALNVESDTLSKSMSSFSAVAVTQRAFDTLFSGPGSPPPPNLDWFADCSNFKVVRYSTRDIRDRDAFSTQLTVTDIVWAFPPLPLFRRAWKTWRDSPSTTIYLVLPAISSSQWLALRCEGTCICRGVETQGSQRGWAFDVYRLSKGSSHLDPRSSTERPNPEGSSPSACTSSVRLGLRRSRSASDPGGNCARSASVVSNPPGDSTA